MHQTNLIVLTIRSNLILQISLKAKKVVFSSFKDNGMYYKL